MSRMHPSHMPEGAPDNRLAPGWGARRCTQCLGVIDRGPNTEITYLGRTPCSIAVSLAEINPRRLLEVFMASQRTDVQVKAAAALGDVVRANAVLSRMKVDGSTPSTTVALRMIMSTGLGPHGLLASGAVILGGGHSA